MTETNAETSATSDRPTMRAISQDELGGPEVLHEIQLPVPTPGPSQILIRVHAAGMNPTDWKHRGHRAFLPSPPFVLGWDVSGVVETVGVGVTLFKPGDEVFGMLPYPFGVGAHAEYVLAPTRAFAPKPGGIDHVQAGAIPLAALTAWQSLVDTAEVGQGDRVLIHAAAGGVGHLAVQIAKARGAYVIGTASEPKHDFVRGMGADEMIDYREVDFAEAVHDIDIVLDTIGGEYQSRSLQTMTTGGILVSTIPIPVEGMSERAAAQGMRIENLLVESDQAGMLAIAGLVRSGQLHASIAGTFGLDEAARAHEELQTNRTAGKLVLTVV
ncbi:NADP-dependent oxidoreductase [Brevibacterium marinum]|uniref:NADPH:quinone reductase-like Zn-dependent oxidoreductase n=1 Tax=Brevibacterium marinum TaxID=418643 RepID=A0A846S333_9MICO|nr:NADP-dependent oxidoreductase [Brevibacterium marinum]NJC58085.1 NADPH:quinone reductase-like Zn-dependent oxidoreductase [Brevibacterium marinum]